MTDRPNDPPAPTYDDRTRDITLPHLPDRPPPALPREWAGLTARREPDAPGPDFSAPAPDTRVAAPAPRPATEVEWADRTMLADQPTDEMGHPRATPSERTLAFSHPEMGQRPVGPVRVAASQRRWHWFVLALLPILIIAGAGITLVLLLRG